jgi:hypothetical protein
MPDNAIQFGAWLNLLVSILVFVVGLLYCFRAPLRKNKFLRVIFAFWLGQWFVFALSWWRIVSIGPDYLVLALGDLQSLLAIGFSIAFLFGQDLKNRWRQILTGLALTYVVLIVINAVSSVGILAGRSEAREGFTQLFLAQWASTGQVMSLIALCALGLSFVLRYGRLGLFMLAACIFYATLQSPIYGALFGTSIEPSYVRLALAFGKTLLGAIFYWLFFEPAIGYARINIPVAPAPPFDWRGLLRRGGVFVLLGLVVVLFAYTIVPSASAELAATIKSIALRMAGSVGALIAVITLVYRLLSPNLVNVRFIVNNAIDVSANDEIFLTGSCRELGHWWPSEAIAVRMDSLGNSTWTAEVEVPAKGEIEFKCIRVTRTWENGSNHKVIPTQGRSVVVAWGR